MVTKIPANVGRMTLDSEKSKTLRVAAYARVSTDMEDQQNSFSAQVLHYTNYIKRHSDWEFVKVYADEGKSGRQVKYRDGFQEMLKDGLDGKFDFLITKSVSRFARNTVDSLQAIRQLKEAGVEVWFEKENIRTFDGRCELMLSLMSSLAQEESRSISENITWGIRKGFEEGRDVTNWRRMLGYTVDNGEYRKCVASAVCRKQPVHEQELYSLHEIIDCCRASRAGYRLPLLLFGQRECKTERGVAVVLTDKSDDTGCRCGYDTCECRSEYAHIQQEQINEVKKNISDAHYRHHHCNGLVFTVEAKIPERNVDQYFRERADKRNDSVVINHRTYGLIGA